MNITSLRAPGLCLTLVVLAGAAAAQYKVVAPDGSVTYTDRPPADTGVRVTPIGRTAPPQPADAGLPIELRQAAQRYPVTLYTSADCTPCDSGRRLLQQRGVPYSEKRVSTEEDAAALDRAVGGRSVPAVTIGAQPLRGFAEADWMSYLDAAGYPRESKLPRNWPVPVATPLVERAAPSVAPGAPTRTSADTRAPEPPAAAASGIRF